MLTIVALLFAAGDPAITERTVVFHDRATDEVVEIVETTYAEAGPGEVEIVYAETEFTGEGAPRSVEKTVVYALGGLLKLYDRHQRTAADGSVMDDWTSSLVDVAAEDLPAVPTMRGQTLALSFDSVTQDHRRGADIRFAHQYRLKAAEVLSERAYLDRITLADGVAFAPGDVVRLDLRWVVSDADGAVISDRTRDYYFAPALGLVVPCCTTDARTLVLDHLAISNGAERNGEQQ